MDILNGIKNFLSLINDNWTTILVIVGLALALWKKIESYSKLSTDKKIEIAKKQGKYKGGKKRISIPYNFEEEYRKWKLGQQSAKVTMEHCFLKRTTFYSLVKEYEKNKKFACRY